MPFRTTWVHLRFIMGTLNFEFLVKYVNKSCSVLFVFSRFPCLRTSCCYRFSFSSFSFLLICGNRWTFCFYWSEILSCYSISQMICSCKGLFIHLFIMNLLEILKFFLKKWFITKQMTDRRYKARQIGKLNIQYTPPFQHCDIYPILSNKWQCNLLFFSFEM